MNNLISCFLVLQRWAQRSGANVSYNNVAAP